jgi:hypothetical protein
MSRRRRDGKTQLRHNAENGDGTTLLGRAPQDNALRLVDLVATGPETQHDVELWLSDRVDDARPARESPMMARGNQP